MNHLVEARTMMRWLAAVGLLLSGLLGAAQAGSTGYIKIFYNPGISKVAGVGGGMGARPVTTVAERYKETRGKDDKKAAPEWLRLADWALKHNMLDEFAKNMEEAAKVDPGHVAVKTYHQVQNDMRRPITRPDDAADW